MAMADKVVKIVCYTCASSLLFLGMAGLAMGIMTTTVRVVFSSTVHNNANLPNFVYDYTATYLIIGSMCCLAIACIFYMYRGHGLPDTYCNDEEGGVGDNRHIFTHPLPLPHLLILSVIVPRCC